MDTSDRDIRQQMKQCASSFLNAREVSAQEATYRLLGLPLYKSNIETVFVPASMPHDRIALLKPKYVLDQLDPDSEDVFVTTIFDRYAARPIALEKTCLMEFAQMYVFAKCPNSEKLDFQPDILPQSNSSHSKKYIKLHWE